jgi:hypothetical protein
VASLPEAPSRIACLGARPRNLKVDGLLAEIALREGLGRVARCDGEGVCCATDCEAP